MENLFYLIPLSGLLAVVFGLMRSKCISDQNPGNEKMQEIGLAIREGATAFLVREYKVLTIFVLTVAAAESAIGLAILVAYYRVRNTIAVEDVSMLRA